MQVSLHRDGREWVRQYQGLGGVKFGQAPMYAGEAGRFAYLENLYRDHDNGYGAVLETMPGFRTIFLGDHPIYGIHFYNSETLSEGRQMLIHAGDTLWKYGVQNVLTTLPTVSISEAGLQAQLQQSLLSIEGEPLVERHVHLSELPLSRGGYSFTCKNLTEEAADGVLLHLSLTDGRTYIVSVGETCDFSLEETQTLRIEVRLFAHTTSFSRALELRLDSTTLGSAPLYGGLRHQQSCSFQMGERFYLLDGGHLLCYDGTSVHEVEANTPADVLWQGKDRKRVLQQRNMLSVGFYNYFYVEETYAEKAYLTFELSDREASPFLVQYLKEDGIWEAYPAAQYTLREGYLTMLGAFNADQRVYEMPLPVDIDLLQPYNLRVYCERPIDTTISEEGREAFSVRYPALSLSETIKRCTIACVHDDRVFLSGNPACPGCVFYSARKDPSFFGTLDFFEDGGCSSRITGMTASGDTLLVCLSGDGKGSAAFYHNRERISDNIQREIYPGTPVAYNLYVSGPCLNFAGELTFLACDGLYGVSRRNAFGERSVWHRSDSVDAKLNRLPHGETRACVWRGYLCLLCADGSLFLADSRQTYKNQRDVVQYEWYYISNVGVYRGQQYHIGQETEQLAGGEAYGGQFLPGRVLTADEQTIYFGCEDGSVAAFWFDKRLNTGGFAPIHYSQNGRRYPSILLTARDDGDVPHLRKRTIPHSTIVRTGTHSNLQAKVYIRTDRAGTQPLAEMRAWGIDFEDLHFEGLSFSAIDNDLFALAECSRGWMEKQYLFVCDAFLSKFSLASLSYSYRLCGRYRTTDVQGG